MTKGFLFGKFLPFHKGHEAMLHFARTQCDFLSVLVCCSDREPIPGSVRKAWIEQTVSEQPNVEVLLYPYLESELPNTSETSGTVSEIWAAIFKKLFPEHTILVTSEPYGELVAGFMQIRHIPFDLEKKRFPVSATAIRNDVFANWHFLPDAVKPDFALKVVLLGTESTGKSTLAEKLAAHYSCSLVPEAARELIADSKGFRFEDLQRVLDAHAQRIAQALVGDSPLVVIDTDCHITKSYAQFVFGRDLEIPPAVHALNKAQLYLYLCSDAGYVQDGTRLTEAERNALDRSHRQVLAAHRVNFVEIRGDWEQRFEQAVSQIDKLISTHR